ncbi:MAG: type II CRISPR-associated endonuclease Cas1 [Proteocatella sp.]
MSWRTVVVSNRAKLELKLGYLVVRGETTTRIHLSEIAMLMIENTAVAITASLLSELSKRKVKVVFCDEKRNPCSELVSYYGSHDTSMKIRNQIIWKEYTCQQVWTEIVSEKIRNQQRLLEELNSLKAGMLGDYIEEMKFNDASNREGHASKVYFNELFGMKFTRASENNINAALNYGYGIILSAFNREIVANGYITQLGLFHDNMFNQFNLSCDLMEPFRPLVDRCVMKMGLENFSKEEKIKLVNILNDETYIEGKKHYVNNAIKIYCRSIFDALNEDDISMMRFFRNEL